MVLMVQMELRVHKVIKEYKVKLVLQVLEVHKV